MTKQGEAIEFFEHSLLMDTDDCIIWPFAKNTYGYAQIWYEHVMTRASRLVCEKIYGPSPTPKHIAAHSPKCISRACINKHHLRWATYEENEADKLLTGTHIRGEKQWMSRLSKYEVLEIRKFAKFESVQRIADIYDVSRTTINDILNEKSWYWLAEHSDAELLFDTTKPRMKDLFA
jgi:hypothetical protein